MIPPSTNKQDQTDDLTPSQPQQRLPSAIEGGIAPTDHQVTQDHVDSRVDTNPFVAPVVDMAADLNAAFADRFEPEKHLGKGGFGSVFEATDRRSNRRVAIKVTRTRSSDPDNLLREARALAQLRHPGIVAVFDVAVAGGHCFVVSELLPGPSLADWIHESLPNSVEAARVAAEVADALAHAHARSIVHRDLKPSNVVFAEGRRPVLVDFGLALSDQDAGAERGLVSGTPAYMSPEQAGGRAHQPDGRTDVYGLAATLYVLLCGRPPFRGSSNKEILRQVREDDPPPPRQLRPEIPAALEAVCLKGLSKLPGDRFTTAADFAEAIRRAIGLLPPASSPAVGPAPLPVPLLSSAPVPVKPPVVARKARSERRQVSLLQFTLEQTGGEDDDPMELVGSFQAACGKVVAVHGGLPLQTSGTGFLACFGYPIAHEDAPRQAVYAALEVCRRMTGIHAAVGTGGAIVTETPGASTVVVGEVTAAVAAADAHGETGAVLVTDGTHRLIRGYFTTEPAGEVRPRGSSVPVPLFRVTAERDARNRMDSVDPTRLSPLVGRDREVALLCERWDVAVDGVRNVILLVADPGLGKSRLVRVLRDHALGSEGTTDANPSMGESTGSVSGSARIREPAICIEWYCSPYHQGSPFYPVTDYFNRTYRLSREKDPEKRLDRLIARLRESGVHDPEDQSLLASMLSVPGGSRLPALGMSADRQKERTLEAVLGWLTTRASLAPVLFVVEDLHWVDPSTEALLTRFVEEGGESRVLGVFTFRPEYDPPWKGRSVQTQVALNRLTRSQVGELIRAQAGPGVPSIVVDQIADRTDGVPLFVEEFTRLVAERGQEGGLNTAIPESLQDLLIARLDRMASDKQVVQLGATIGRTFGYDLIRATFGQDEATLRSELNKLVEAGLLFSKGSHPRCTYTFKHALIQDAAYQSLMKKQRQQLHRTVAETLERQFPEVVETQPELLARHFTEAGETGRAVDYSLKAGERSRERSAYREAIRHFGRGLELIATLPESGQRDRVELKFQIPLATTTTIACGWGDPGLQLTHQRARELCTRIGSEAPTFHVTWGEWAWRVLRSELDIADALAVELENQASTLDDGYRMEACFALACTTIFRGEFERALSAGPRGLMLYDPARCAFHARFTGQNAFSTISAFFGWARAICGFPDEAVRIAAESLRVSQSTRDKYSEEFCRYHLGCVQQHCRLGSAARASGEEVIAIGIEQGFATWVALGTLCQGAGLVIEGQNVIKGLELIDAGMHAFKTAGAELGLSNYLAISAEGFRKINRPDQAWDCVNRGFAMAERTHEGFQLSNLHRIRGDLLLDQGTAEASVEAEAAYQRAIDIARDQKARSWELRPATSLCRLWQGSGRRDEGRPLLANILGWFTEGLQLPDLVEAKTLLDEMA